MSVECSRGAESIHEPVRREMRVGSVRIATALTLLTFLPEPAVAQGGHTMRSVIYGAACSLDGFIADASGGVDWLHFSSDVNDFMKAFWKRIDTVIMGRKTWEVAAAQGGGSMPGIKATYVFSRTLTSISNKKVKLVSTDPGEFVRDLKQQPGKDICVLGGGDFGRSLLAAGVVDEVGANIHPVLLG